MNDRMDDRRSAGTVEVLMDDTGKFWVNVDGRCALRIGKVEQLDLEVAPGPGNVTHKLSFKGNPE